MRCLLLVLCVVACGSGGPEAAQDAPPPLYAGDPVDASLQVQTEPEKAPDAGQEEIIFITPSRSGNRVRAMRPDGEGGRTVFAVPDYASKDSLILEVNASPDGRQIAFSSNHDWDRSYNLINVYVVNTDGSNLRRPTDAPSVPQLRKMKTGKVKVQTKRLVGGGELSVWVQGAEAPVRQMLREGESDGFTVKVADFGPDMPQYVRVFNHHPGTSNACNFDPAVRADVKPGKTVDAGAMPMLFSMTCPQAWSPGWISNDRLVLMYAEPDRSLSPNNIWTVDADIAPGELGSRWYDTGGESGSNSFTRVFAGETEGKLPGVVAIRQGALKSGLYAAPRDDPASIQGGLVGLCDTTVCKATSIDATPDGTVALLTVAATDAFEADFSAIYVQHDDGAFKQILKLENEVIGTAAMSPDGTQIVFDRARGLIDHSSRVKFGERPQCPCSIWRVNVDGTGLTKIADDGRAPDWSR